MKTHFTPNTMRSERGVALVIVLSVLVLMSALLVSFMGRVSSERLSQRAASASFEAKQAYESAVNLVISQIREATSDESGGVAWASQPGLIRTFNADDNLKVFKLYSSNEMQVSDKVYNPASVSESGFDPAKPTEDPAGFVNLNDPIFVPSSTVSGAVDAHYPIVNPHARLTTNNALPSSFGRGRVEGFDGAFYSHRSKATDALTKRPVEDLPMRAKWLYHLKDGTLVAPNDAGVINGASKDNPPVARVAFWTDDESAKLNVNTAGENTFWDTPSASVPQESGNVDSTSGEPVLGMNSLYLAASQPAAREYQRFPGHPATTSLSPAMRWLAPPSMSDVDFKEAIYRLSPRLMDGYGSSVAATRNTDMDINFRITKRDRLFASLDDYWFRPDRSPISGSGYAKVFRPTGSMMSDKVFANATPEAMEMLRFFLTANSRAPELNLFGKPRIGMWPVHETDDPVAANSKRTAFDDLIAFCGTLDNKAYYFVRKDPWSPTVDYNAGEAKTPGRNKDIIEQYLKNLSETRIPGAGGKFSDKYNTASGDFASATEMQRIILTIFDYIRCINLVDTGSKNAAPGFPLAYTRNYENSNPPVYDGSRKPNLGSGQVTPTVVYGMKPEGSVPMLKGFGRFVTVSEMVMLFYHDDQGTDLPGDPAGDRPADWNVKDASGNPKWFPIRCVVFPETYLVAPNYPALSEAYAYKMSETKVDGTTSQLTADPLKISYTNPVNPTLQITKELFVAETNHTGASLNYIEVDSNRTGDGRFFMPTRGFSSNFLFDAATPSTANSRKAKLFSKPNPLGTGTATEYSKFPFYSRRIWIPSKAGAQANTFAPQTEFRLEGGSLTLDLLPLSWSAANPTPPANVAQMVQRYHFTFPANITVPTPKSGFATFPYRVGKSQTGGGAPWYPDIQPQTTDPNRSRWIPYDSGAWDTIRSLEPNSMGFAGDYRLLAATGNVPINAFGKSGQATGRDLYADKTQRAVHNLRNGWGRRIDPSGLYGKVTDGSNPRTDKVPDVPTVPGIAANIGISMRTDGTPGDFDRGISKHMDGPFINRPDEGNVRFKLNDNPGGGGHLPYFRGGNGYEEVGQTFFSPNRLVSSPVVLGSLPTGVHNRQGWQTLLFHPAETANGIIGDRAPKDHFMLDWFCMPVVEPYAISEPLSTAGRVNLNQRLAPYGYVKVNGRSYIERSTGLHGVLKGMWQMVVPSGFANSGHAEEPLKATGNLRHEIDRFATIEKVINPRFDNNKFFKSPTEICDMDLLLVSGGFSDPVNRKAFWKNNDQTGDNQREKPYAHIYPRLTTKSNVYTVYAWAQRIAKNPATKDNEWDRFDEVRDRVVGDYRGSTTIERYIDQNDPILKGYDAVKNPNAPSLDRFYRYRIINHKRFTPQ